MALALLELTEISGGEVLEQLAVITIAEAADLQHAELDGAINRLRLFAQIDSVFPRVPPSVHVRLERAALSSLEQLALRRISAVHDASTTFMALWHDGHLLELHSHSLTDGLAVWLQQSGPIDDYVMLELSNAPPTVISPLEQNLEASFARLRDNLANCIHHHYGHVQAWPLTIGGIPPCLDNLAPAQELLLDAADQRNALATQWLSATQVSVKLDAHLWSDGHRASQLRREGQLLGVYVTQPVPSYRYPTWQFRPDGEPVDHLAEILTVLRDHGPFQREPEGLHRTTGWGEVEWFLTPHVLLDGAPPAATLSSAPDRVLRAARIEFENDP